MNKVPKVPKIFLCKICDYNTSRESQYTRHLSTSKHKILINPNKKVPKIVNNKDNNFVCDCGKEYKHLSSLCYHKKKCNNKIITNEIIHDNNHEINELKNIVKDLIKQNNDLIKTITEITPKIGNTTITNNMNNTNNNFNLHFFLNEQCKDAININEFVNSLEITIDDLNYTKDNGLMKGITDVMIRGLKELDIYKRPIHCTDIKRETLYIKDENKWEKDEHNEKMKETIIIMANKERDAINAWKEEYPLWNKDEEVQDEFMLLVNKVYTPIEEKEHYEKKIIKALTKEVSIEK